ncbi:MAG: MBOAT family protein [Termitinemataceae bacterium]|nr:MAG: MBOAT family protein [Termitinemataceae bacterium]
MLFSSLTFIIAFLPLVLIVYYYCPTIKTRNYFLLIASFVFYAWGEPKYVLVMLVSILLNYRCGILLAEQVFSKSTRRFVLAAGITLNLLLLFYFKYFTFSERIINKIFRMIDCPQFQVPLLDIALPLGISFYTFQSISYLADVYKRPCMAQNNILNLGLYISFFPQLIAGPIVRWHDINLQIQERAHSTEFFSRGAGRFIVGLSKKVLIANTMAAMADEIFSFSFQSIPFYFLVLGIVCYTFQIYYDFSGYSGMAIGLGMMFGFNIPENFNYPYASKSITEFWRRWHISLSLWFKDYLYIPLGGNRKGKLRTTLNLFIVFFTTGLWHGAALNFIVWGLGHGTLLFFEKIYAHKIAKIIKNQKLRNFCGHLYMLITVILLWVFFRFGIKESLRFMHGIFSLNQGSKSVELFINAGIGRQFIISFFAAVCFAFPWWKKISALYNHALIIPRYAALIILLILSFCQLASGTYNPFIYFRF